MRPQPASATPAKAHRPSAARDRETFAGLAHLVAPMDALADRVAVLDGIDALVAGTDGAAIKARDDVRALLAETLEQGRARALAGLLAEPRAGLRVARAYAYVTDVVVSGVTHYATTHLHPAPIRTRGERLSVIAVGGYGRGEMAPFSDVDLLFLTPWKRTAWAEASVESILYLLWDLKLKIGQATRSIDECIRLAASDLTIRTNLLEQRLIAGDPAPAETLERRLWDELFLRTGPEFVQGKLAERDKRHSRHGGSRYLLEPNIKEGKGGLRDLQTLHWISRYLYRSTDAWDLVERGVFEHDEVARFAEAAKFLWATRCHLHDLAGRATEVLSFDRQVEIAARMGYEDAEGRMGVERFMHAYFRHAKNVGDLTRIFSAALETQHAKPMPRFSSLLSALSLRGPESGGDGVFTVRDGRLALSKPDTFEQDPLSLLALFREAARTDARIHPEATRAVTRALDLIDDDMRADPRANALFLELITDRKNAEWLPRLLNETGVLGRFLPEFGRIVALMQFNMYHHYTVDEHTLETLRILARIERGEVDEDHPVATEIARQGFNRRVLYVALLLHDIGKGQRRDHSELGAEIAADVCPRLGLSESETDLVVWLVRHHLLMSDVAQKRDIADPVTIQAFAREVQSPERLRLLLILTVCDIRGVGPGTWNNWKAQLLRKLYWDTRSFLTSGGDVVSTQAQRIREAKETLAAELPDWDEADREAELERHYPQYWLGLETEAHRTFAELDAAFPEGSPADGIQTRFLPDEAHDATVAYLYLHDHPGLFSRMAGAFAISSANVVDARSYTTADGMACALFWIQDADGHPFEASRLHRLRRSIERALKGEVVVREAIAEKDRPKAREQSFRVAPTVVFDNEASELYTVIEVNARDRLGLLHVLTRTLAQRNVNIFTAIIATYGERAVDVFYVKDLFGLKIRSAQKQKAIEAAIIRAVESHVEDK
ncbi:MAG: [protein-PII] uridylyltransferase [Pseudomonadota bacterium]